MIHITETAAEQIIKSIDQSAGVDQSLLRIAVKKNDDGSFHYAMGFDDAITEDDHKFECNGVNLVISPKSVELATGMTIDFVELENEQFNFIFMNPNDPAYVPVKE